MDNLASNVAFDQAAETARLGAMREPMHPAMRLLLAIAVILMTCILFASQAHAATGTTKCRPTGCWQDIRPWAKPVHYRVNSVTVTFRHR